MSKKYKKVLEEKDPLEMPQSLADLVGTIIALIIVITLIFIGFDSIADWYLRTF